MTAHIVVCVSSYHHVSKPVNYAIHELLELGKRRGVVVSEAFTDDWAVIEHARVALETLALNRDGMSHALFVDEVVFEPEDVLRMLSVDEAIVLAGCRARKPPHAYVLKALEASPLVVRGGQRVIRVAAGGLAFGLVKRIVLEAHQARHPHLCMRRYGAATTLQAALTAAGSDRIGDEDVSYVSRMSAAGFPIHVAIDVATTRAGVFARVGDEFPTTAQTSAQAAE